MELTTTPAVANLRIVHADGVTRTPKGDVIVRIHQAAYMPEGRTIISPGQMEWNKVTVDERPKTITGKTPSILTLEGYEIPISIRKGLPYISLRPPSDEERKTLPKINLTSPYEWNPSVLDSKVNESWYNKPVKPWKNEYSDEIPFDHMGNLKDKPVTTVEDEDDEDKQHQSIDRQGIKAFLCDIIEDELQHDFEMCNINGELHQVRWDEDWRYFSDSDSESDDERYYKTFPAKRRPRKAKQDVSYAPDKRPKRKDVVKKSKKKKVEHTTDDGANDDDDVPDLEPRNESDPDSSESETEHPRGVRKDRSSRYNNRARAAEEALAAAKERLNSVDTGEVIAGVEPRLHRPAKKDVSEYSKFFPGTDADTLRKTFDATTQYGRRGATGGHTLHKQGVSPNPVLNVPRRHEDVATDTLYSDTPAVDDGSTAAQFFIGRKSIYRTAHSLGKSDKNFVHTLHDEIQRYGAMDKIISDNAKAQISDRVKDILRTFNVKDWQSEPYKGNQNFAERGWRDTKTKVNSLLNQTGADPSTWFLALQYVCFVQNHTAVDSLGGRTPTEWMLGYTPDISVLLQFRFYEPVYYAKYDAKFPSDSTELCGRFVGIADNVGHAMTYKILTEDNKVICRAVVRTALKTGGYDNKRAKEAAPNRAPKYETEPVTVNEDDEADETVPVTVTEEDDDDEEAEEEEMSPQEEFISEWKDDIVRSLHEDRVEKGEGLPTIDTSGLLGRTFIPDPDENGEQHRAKVENVEPMGETTSDHTEQLYKFRCKVGEKTFEKIMTYNKMVEWCDRDLDKDNMYKIEEIIGHRRNPKSKGGYDLHLRWGDGTIAWNELSPTYNDDPVSVSLYAMNNKLLHLPGFKRCKNHTKNLKTLARMINQSRLKNLRTRPVYQYGFQVPRNHEEAVFIDERCGNTNWQDAEKLEIKQLLEYDTFKDLGKGTPIPSGYQKIPCHMIYAVKHDGRHKARMVAGGHRTETPVDSIYSSVVSLPGIRLVTFLAELNEMELWGTDIGNAYLESFTKEKVCFIAGGEFGELAGHTFMIIKAQYGLKSSGKMWHDRLFDVLYDMGFRPSKAEEDIWMRDMGDHYEYLACYVDDLAIASKNPQAIIDALEGAPNNFKLKGTGPMQFHLGCDFFRDEEGVLCVGPRKYIERMEAQYVSLFGSKPKTNVTSPLEKNDHPELDTSPLLGEDDIVKYQSIIGVLQWAITLGRFDIATAVMSMSSYRVAPREGHMSRLQRICGYLSKMKHGFLRVRTDEPDYSDLPDKHYSWERSVYGDVREQIPRDAPKPLGKRVVLTTYVDANLNHDLVTGRSVSGVLHFVNQTPVHWFTKKQPTVETATYGSEFIAAKLAVEQIMAMRLTLRYLGVEIHGSTHLFGDNGSVVTSSSIPESPLRKRHQALAYHYTREAIASKAVDFRHLPGDLNPADILSKHWGYAQVWPMLRTVMFWTGNPSKLLLEDTPLSQQKGSEKCSVSTGSSSNPEDTPGSDEPVESQDGTPNSGSKNDSADTSPEILGDSPSPTV